MQTIRPLGGPLTADHRTANAHTQAHEFYQTNCPVRCDSADRRAANLLISPARFLKAAQRDHRVAAIAANLYVTETTVRTYIQNLPVEDWLRMRNLVGLDPL